MAHTTLEQRVAELEQHVDELMSCLAKLAPLGEMAPLADLIHKARERNDDTRDEGRA